MNGYRELKLSLELFKKPPGELLGEERKRLARAATNQDSIEAKILRSPEAAAAIVTAQAISARRQEIRGRYPDAESFTNDLERLGLDEAALDAELARELSIEGALEQVSARVSPTSEVEAEIFYRVNLARFSQPERRRLRHILVTFNNAAEKKAAQKLLTELANTLQSEEAFSNAATRHSHCPTGLEGGMLGTMPRGKLYPELDAVAFALAEGEISAPAESEIGLHILRCDRIQTPSTASYAEVRDRIISSLDERRQREVQKRWIETLK